MRLPWAILTAAALILLAGCGGEPAPVENETTTLAAPTETTQAPPSTTLIGSLDASEMIVREGPGLQYAAIGGMARGEAFTVVAREGDWYRITFGDGFGYISAHYADIEGSPNASEMLSTLITTAPPTTAPPATSQTTGTAQGSSTAAPTAAGAAPG